MAVTFTLIKTSPIRFQGLNADSKPTTYAAPGDAAKAVPAGSIFIETDTGNTDIFSGTSWYQIGTGGAGRTGTLASTTVAVAGLTTIGAAIDVSNFNFIKVVIDNSDDTGSAAIKFDAFEIQTSSDGGANFETEHSTSGDFTGPTEALIGTSGDLTALAANARGWFRLDVQGIDQIRVQASADTTQSVGVTGTWSAN